MAHEKVSVTIHNVTKAFVDDFKNKYPSHKGERTLNMKRVEYLKTEIAAGRVMPFNWAIVFVEKENMHYRANGNHSTLALQQLGQGKPLPTGMKIVLTEYYAETMQDFTEIYNRYDGRMNVRSVSDTLQPERLSNKSLENVSSPVMVALASAKMWLDNGYRKPQHTIRDAERVEALRSCDEFIPYFMKLYKGGTAALFLKRVPVMSAIMKLWEMHRVSPVCLEGIAAFWSRVRDGAELRAGSPELTLRNRLMTATHSKSGQKPASNGDIYAWCINAWNAFVSAKTVRGVQGVGSSGKVPVPIKLKVGNNLCA